MLAALDDLVRAGKVLHTAISDTPAWVVAQGNTCVSCGGNGERCCTSNTNDWCGLGFACNANARCEPCGGTGQVCCSGRFGL